MNEFDSLPTPETQPKKKNTTLIIAIVALVLVCCCCACLAILGWNFGDQIIYELGL